MAIGPLPGEVPSGAIMQPRYMGRVMNTYPVSEPEMENISSLSAAVTTRFSAASLLFGLAASIWTNALFYTDLTPAGMLATRWLGPFLLFLSIGFVAGGIYARSRRVSAWEKIKQESQPVQTVAPAAELIVPQS
jgi:hypothetical protein